jgi:hypothetical protein
MRQRIQTMRAVWPASAVPCIAEWKRCDDKAAQPREPSQDGIDTVIRQQGSPICRSGAWGRDVEVGGESPQHSR